MREESKIWKKIKDEKIWNEMSNKSYKFIFVAKKCLNLLKSKCIEQQVDWIHLNFSSWTRFITWNKVSKLKKCTNNAFMSNGLNGIFPPKNAFFQPRCIWYCLKQSWKKTDVATTNIENAHHPKFIPGFGFRRKTLNLIDYVFF